MQYRDDDGKIRFHFLIIKLNVAKRIFNVKGGYDKKTFRRLINVLLTLFDMHLSERHFRFKAPSGVYGLSFVAFKRFFIMSDFQMMGK